MRSFCFVVAALVLAVLPGRARSDSAQVRITRQPGLPYLPLVVMEREQLLEKHASREGLPNLKVEWVTFNSGGAASEALLAGKVDLMTTGVSNLLLLWDRTKGDVRGVAAVGATPILLVTRNASVKTLRDFTDKDRIALPTVKVSDQAIALQMAAEKEFGPEGRHRLDAITVQMGHPDAYAAIMNPQSEINSHFSLPPFQQLELKDPRLHAVVGSADVVNGPLTTTVIFGTRKFHDDNPKIIDAFMAASGEADEIANRTPERAAQIYLDATKEKLSAAELAAMMKEPGVSFTPSPSNTMAIAEHLVKAGIVKSRPTSWEDYFFPEVKRFGIGG